MKTVSTFTIVTPSFNQANFIEETITSILNQAGEFRIQYIVADAGSTDGSVDIIKKYADMVSTGQYPIKCLGITMTWWSRPDKGQSDAINQGFQKATGEFVAYLNTDDYYLPNALANVTKAFKKYPNTGAIYSDFIEVDADGKELRRHKLPDFDLQYVIDGNVLGQPATFVRKTALDSVGLLNPQYHYAMDYDLWVRIGKQFPIQHVAGSWAAFRLHGDSKTVALAASFWKEERKISRSNGGRFFSRQYIHHVHTRFPRLVGLLLRLHHPSTGHTAPEVLEVNRRIAAQPTPAPALAVIIPTLDRQPYTLDTIRQILADKFKDTEVIVVDQSDELLPETLEFLAKNQDARLFYYHVRPKSGVAAKNFALLKATANIVVFFDDDVTLDPGCLAAHYEAYQKHPGIGGVAGRVKQHNIPITNTLLHFNRYALSGYTSFNYQKAEYTDTAAGGNMSVKRIEALRIGGFDINFLRSQHREESEFSARYLRAGNSFYFEPKASIVHLAAHSGGTRHTGDFADFPDFYKNNLYFVLRYCKWYDLPMALIKQLRFYALRKNPIISIHRSLLFAWGLLVAVRRIIKSHQIQSVLIKEYHHE